MNYMPLELDSLVGSWRFMPIDGGLDPAIPECWLHFCEDNHFAMEFLAERHEWNRNWLHFSITGADEITTLFLGTYQRKVTPKYRVHVVQVDGQTLFFDSYRYEKSVGRPMPGRYDILSGSKEIEGAPTEKWCRKFELMQIENIDEKGEPERPLERLKH